MNKSVKRLKWVSHLAKKKKKAIIVKCCNLSSAINCSSVGKAVSAHGLKSRVCPATSQVEVPTQEAPIAAAFVCVPGAFCLMWLRYCDLPVMDNSHSLSLTGCHILASRDVNGVRRLAHRCMLASRV